MQDSSIHISESKGLANFNFTDLVLLTYGSLESASDMHFVKFKMMNQLASIVI